MEGAACLPPSPVVCFPKIMALGLELACPAIAICQAALWAHSSASSSCYALHGACQVGGRCSDKGRKNTQQEAASVCFFTAMCHF